MTAQAFHLPTPAGKLRLRAGATSPRCTFVRSGQSRAPSVPTRVRDLSTTRASRTPGERGGELVSEQALLPGTRRAPDSTNSPRESCCLAASTRLSPPRHTFPLAPAAALTSGPPCAHPCPRSPTTPLPSTPAAPCRSLAPPRSLPPAPGERLPRPAAGPASTPCRRGVLAPGSHGPGPRPAPARWARGRSPRRRAERSGRWGREARGAAARAGEGALVRSLSAAHTPVQTLTQTHAGCAAAARRCSSSRHRLEREREGGRESALSARRRPARDSAPRRQPRRVPASASASAPGRAGRPRWGEPG